MERGSSPLMCHPWATSWLPGALSYRHPSAVAVLVAETDAHLPTLLHLAIFIEAPCSDYLRHLVNTGSEPPFITAISQLC